MEPSTEDTDWMEFFCKSGQLLFYYNKVTAEHRWPDTSNGYENGTPIYGRSLVCVGTQTDDYGCSYGCGTVHVDGGVIQSINVEEEDPLAQSSNLHEDVSPASQESSDVVFYCANESQVLAEVIANSSLGLEGTTQSDVFYGSSLIQSNNVKEEDPSTECPQLAENVLLALGPSENTVFDSGSEMQVMAEVTEDCSVGATTQSDYGCSNGCGPVHVVCGVIQSINVKEEGTSTESSQLHEDLSQVSGENSNVVSHFANESQVMAEVIANSSLGDTTQSDVFGGSGLIQSNNVKEEATSTESWQLSQLAENVLLASGPSENTVFDSGSEMQVMADVTEDCSVGATTQSVVFDDCGLIQSNNVEEGDPSTDCPQLAENVLLASGPSENTVFDSGGEMQVMAEVTEDCSVGATTQSDVFAGSGLIQSNNVKEGSQLAENELPSAGSSDNMVTKYGLYKCMRCGRTFTHKRNLDQHGKVHSTKSYVCDTCGREFKHRNSLRYHGYTHTGIKPHECKTCSKRFTHKGNLNRHEYIHTGTKPHECKTCGKRFIQLGSLKGHERTHTGTKPYECKTCGKTFTVKQCLKRHEYKYTHGDS